MNEQLFGELVVRFRKRLGISRAELGRRVGCDPSAIAHYELSMRQDRTSGGRHPQRGMAESLALALELSEAERHQLIAAAGYWPYDNMPWSDGFEALMQLARANEERLTATLAPLVDLLERIEALGLEAERIERFISPIQRLTRPRPTDWAREPLVSHSAV